MRRSRDLLPRVALIIAPLLAIVWWGATPRQTAPDPQDASVTSPPTLECTAQLTVPGGPQSPVDIALAEARADDPHRVVLHYGPTLEHVVHKEHTIEVEYDAGSTIEFDDEVYELEQLHFHTPSEHLVDGRRFPVEMHLVHRSEAGAYLVVGVLFRAGEPNPFLETVLADAPASLGRVDRDRRIDVATVFPSSAHFLTYAGSFTTPPYTEGVQWLVLAEHPEASAEQIVRLLVLEGGNAREAQPIGAPGTDPT